MKLVVGEMYELTFSSGEENIVRVYSDNGDGWYTVRTAYGNPEFQSRAPEMQINIMHVVSIRGPIY